MANIDDIVILALSFARGAGHRATARNIPAGQYLGFTGTLAAAVAAAFRATFLPSAAIPHLGLLPLALGVKAAIQAWRHRDPAEEAANRSAAPRILEVAAVTFDKAHSPLTPLCSAHSYVPPCRAPSVAGGRAGHRLGGHARTRRCAGCAGGTMMSLRPPARMKVLVRVRNSGDSRLEVSICAQSKAVVKAGVASADGWRGGLSEAEGRGEAAGR